MDSKYYQNKRKNEQKQRDIIKYHPVKKNYTPRDAEYWDDNKEEYHVSVFKRDENYMSEYQKKEWNEVSPIIYGGGIGVGLSLVVIVALAIGYIFTS